jgi:ADP-ribosylglycohydrolase
MARPDAAIIADRARGSYVCALVADALSMPVHWYYNPADIDRDFGRITTFVAPKARHPSSIMALSNTGGAGRGRQDGSIIGDVINHGKKHLWGVANQHYHVGMRAGENTLNAIVLRLLARTLSSEKDLPRELARGAPYSPSAFLGSYVAFMQTPGSHNDTYAETWHRMFFKNLVAGREPADCADDDGHNIDSAGGLVLLSLPSLMAAAGAAGATPARDPLSAAADAAVSQQMSTHKSPRLARFSRVYAASLARVFLSPAVDAGAGAALRAAATDAAKSLGSDVAALAKANPGEAGDRAVIGGGGAFSSACYIEGSLPALLYLAAKYADSPADALIANTNVGGENCHRGAALGALVGAAHGLRALSGTPWAKTLADAPAIAKEADDFAAAVVAALSSGAPEL